MAVTYAGLTIEFGGDTKGLSDALKKIQGEAKTTNSDLKAIEKSLKFNPGNTDLLAQKVRNLNKAYDETKSKLDAYKQAMQQLEAKKERGEQLTEQEQRQYEQLQRSILQAENQLESIEGDIKSTSAEFEASQTKIYQWGQALEDNSVKFEKIGQGMQKVGGAATKYVTAPLIAVGTAAGKAAFDVDEALTGVRKTVDATEDEYKQLRDAAIEYSKTHPISATDILAAEELAGQLGVDKQNLQEFAAVATGLDLATNMNVDQAATNLARFANVTNMSKLEGEDAERAYRSYGNVIVGLGNNLATTESEVSDFSLRMASAGTQAGMTEADILGIAGAMSSVGLEAASGGSAFSKTITDIGIAVATGSEDLEKYAAVAGMSADEFSEYWQKDATGAFIAFINGLANGSEDMNVILEDLGITELRQSDALRRLAGNTDLLTDAVKLANDEWDNGTALADEVAAKGDSVGGKITTLKNKVTALLAKIGEPLLDALTDAIDAAEPFLTTLGDMAQQFADMPKEQQQFILKLAAAAAAFGPVTSAGGKLVENLGTIGTGMKAASTFFAGIGGPAATASTAVGGVATSAGGLSGAWGTMTGFIAAHPIGLGIAAVAAATAGLTYFFTQTETGKQLWSDFTGWVSEKWQGVQDFFAGVPDWWNGVCEGWRQTQEANNQAMNELWEGLKSDAGVLKETVSREWEQMKTDVSNAAQNLGTAVSTKWGEVKQWTTESWENVKTTVSTTAGNIATAVSTKWDEIKSATSERWESVKSTVSGKWDGMKQAVSEKAGQIKGNIAQWNENVRSDVTAKWESIKGTISDKWDSIKSAASEKWSAIKSTVTDRVASIKDTITSKLGAARDSASSIFGSIKSAIGEKIRGARDTVSSVIEQIKSKFNFKWKLPHLALPHVSIWGSFSLFPPMTPSFSVSWYKQGGAIQPNNPHLIGVGDSHEREWIEPESKLLRLIEDAVRGVGGAGGNVTVEVNVTAQVAGNTSAYQLGQNIGRGLQSVLKQQGANYA